MRPSAVIARTCAPVGRAVRAAGVSLLVAAPAAGAQDTASTAPVASAGGWLVGGAIGVPRPLGDVEPTLAILGLQVTQFRPMRPGLDISVGFAPRLIEIGGVGARAGVPVPVPVGDGSSLTLLPMVGVSAIAALAGEGAFLTGFTVGGSALLGSPDRSSARVGVTVHSIEGGEAIWLLEVGFAVLRGRN